MSAFICNDITTATVALWAAGGKAPNDALQKLGEFFRAENGHACEIRYPQDKGITPPFKLPSAEIMAKIHELHPDKAYGAIRGYRYQLQEYEGWEFSPAAILAQLALASAEALATDTDNSDNWTIGLSDLS